MSGLESFPSYSFPFADRPDYFIHISAENKIAAINEFKGDFQLALSDSNAYEFSSLFEYSVPKTHIDWTYARVGDIDYDGAENKLFINFQMDYLGSGGKSHIIQYDFAIGELSVLIDGVDLQGTDVDANSMAYADSALYFYPEVGATVLHRIPLETLLVEEVDAEVPIAPRYLQSNSAEPETIIGIAIDDIFKFDTVSGQVSSISAQENQSELLFSLSEWHDSDIDEYNNQLLVKDAALDMIVGVDLETGERSRFFHSGVGTGKAILDPWALAIDEERNRIYVFDSGINAPETILAVDMETGNRSEIGAVNRSANWETNSLVLDSEANNIYAIFPQEVAMVDIDSNTTYELTGGDIGGGVEVSWMDNGVLDTNNNRLLVADGERIVAIDLSSGLRSVMSSGNDSIGAGASFGRIGGLAMNALGTKLVATGVVDNAPALFEVDLISGDRIEIEGVCPNTPEYSDIEYYGDPYPYHPVVMNATGSKLYMFGKSVVTLDLKTNICTADAATYGADVARTSLGQWFTLSQNELIQFDVESNERVIVSK